jgi:AraC-like DNA-binding protein
MGSHGEAARSSAADGTIVLSSLPAGMSRIHASSASIKLVLEGEELYTIDGRTRRIRAGEFMIVAENTDAVVKVSSGAETKGLCIYLPHQPTGLADAGSPVILGTRMDRLSCVLRGHSRSLARREHGAKDVKRICSEAGRYADEFVARMLSHCNRLDHSRAGTGLEVMQRLERARAYLHERTDGPLTLDDICDQAGISRFHLARLFCAAYGEPPLRYHRRLRLERAARQLRGGNMSATAAAQDAGYGNLSAFTRAFRRQFGVPPSSL